MAQMTQATSSSERSTDEVRVYLDLAGREPLLTKEQEVELAMAVERGRDAQRRLATGRIRSPRTKERLEGEIRRAAEARERFIVSNLRLVVSVAKRYQGQGLTLLDLVQEGNLGLMRAVELFDWRRGFKFSTYATWWIRQAITRAVADRGRTIRLPVHVSDRIRKVKAVAREIEQRTGHQPAPDVVAEAIGLSREAVVELLELERREPVSLETPVGDDAVLGEFVEASDEPGPDEEVLDRLGTEAVLRAVESLGERDRAVLELRFGLDGAAPRSLREVGHVLGLSAERVRMLERDALARLRASPELAAA